MSPQVLAIIMAAITAIEKLATAIPAIMNIARELKTSLTAMQAEGRDPTPEEWAAINSQIDVAMAELD